MAHRGRKKIATVPRNAWQSTLDHLEGSEPTQAGEVDADLQEERGRDAEDAEAGSSGYAGDAVETGHDEAVQQPERPTGFTDSSC